MCCVCRSAGEVLLTASFLKSKKWLRFKSLKRGYVSFLIFIFLLVFTAVLELLVNSRPLVVHYQDHFYFPTYGNYVPGKKFGLDYDYETNYRELNTKFQSENNAQNWLILPPIPYNPFEADLNSNESPPYAPNFAARHYLGTDISGRDIVARLSYGFRTAIYFGLILLMAEYIIGVTLGIAMGYFGGWFDLFMQRLIEVWSNLPFLYVIMIVSSFIVPSFLMFVGIMVFFSWINLTWYMRTASYKERARDYVASAKVVGTSDFYIIIRHILPNVVSLLVTFMPFTLAGSIVSLTSLDYLGFGLPPPTPSWGELLAQGTANLQAIWIVASVVTCMVCLLIMVTFIGEAVREAFDPKKYAHFE